MHLTRYVVSGRAELATEIVGNGTPVVFLHANVCDRRMWSAQLDGIGSVYKAVSYDRRGFGDTRSQPENFSAFGDLMKVLDETADGKPAILVGCSLGGRIALDAALRQPERVRALILIAPNVAGAPEATYSAQVSGLMAQARGLEKSGDLARLNAMKARLFLDGPLGAEGRVVGPARDLFLQMNGLALRSPPVGMDVDVPAFYHRLTEVTAPTFVLWGELDFPHVQERCRHITAAILEAHGFAMQEAAHLPGLERPDEVTGHIADFIARLKGNSPGEHRLIASSKGKSD